MLNEKAILELQDRLDAEHKADKAAIKRVLQLLSKHKVSVIGVGRSKALRTVAPVCATFSDTTVANQSNGDSVNGIESRILSVVKGIATDFTFADLLQAVEKSFGQPVDRKTVSWVIYRNKDKGIRIVTPGRGRRKAVYARQ